MNKNISFAGLFLLLIVFSTAVVRQQKQQAKAPVQDKISGYEYAWKSIDSLSTKGLYKSASEMVQQVYGKARAEGNMPQLVKAALYRSRFQNTEGREGIITVIGDLEKDCNEARFPAAPVLHSILAEVYWRYYEQNRWRFLGRSETTGIDESDIQTWDLKKIAGKTVAHYLASLQPEERLKQIPVDVFESILVEGKPEDSRELRPTLYDFLAHRALEFFMNTEGGLTQVEPTFDLNKPEFFGNADRFAGLNVTSEDSLDFKYHAIKILQELTRHHRHFKDVNTFLEIELTRLRFLYRHAVIDQEDTIYIFALRQLANNTKDFKESTEALYEIARVYETFGAQYNMGADESKLMYLRSAEDVCDQAIARFPYSQGGMLCKALKARSHHKELNVTAAMVYAPNENLKLRLQYRNLNEAFVRLVRNDAVDIAEPERLDEDKKLKRYLKMPLVKEWKITLPPDDDRQSHATEFKTDSLKRGNYVLLVSSDEAFTREKQCVSLAEFFVSDLSYLSRKNSGGETEVQVLHRTAGIPLREVMVNAYLSDYNYTSRKYETTKQGTYVTDAEGKTLIPSIGNYRNMRLEFIYHSDRLFTKELHYQFPEQPREKHFSERTFFFTDRSIYRPGQTVYFKGLILESNGDSSRINKNEETDVEFTDANDQQVSELNLVTNEFGTFHGSFTAPTTLTGQMRISNESGSAFISVEDYKRPKFEVKFDPVTGAYRLGETIQFRGEAETYSGAAVNAAIVKYKVTRKSGWIEWPWWKSILPRHQQEVIVAQGKSSTDEYGRFTVSFEAKPDFNITRTDDTFFYFTITADVTDQNGETRTGSQQIKVSYQTLRLSISLKEHLQKENPSPLIIRAENSAGQSEPLTGEIMIYRLQQPSRPLRKSLWANPDRPLLTPQEAEKYFPLDENDNMDPMKWKKDKTVLRSSFDLSKDSVLRFADLPGWQTGYYLIELQSKDKYEAPVKILRPFVIYSVTEKQSPVTQPFWIKEIRNNAEPGGRDSILLASGEEELNVLYELEQKGRILHREWISLKKQQRILEIPIEESYRGNVTAHFVAVKNNREYRNQITLTVPWTNKELDIVLKTFRNKTEPGSKEEWNLVVKGRNGERVSAEMLASMYDASLDAFLPHAWNFSIYPQFHPQRMFTPHAFGNSYSYQFSKDWNEYVTVKERTYDELNWFGFDGGFGRIGKGAVMTMQAVEIQSVPAEAAAAKENAEPLLDKASPEKKETHVVTEAPLIKARSNFNETVFFYPQLKTNENGEIIFSFTIPDALTRWKAQFFAHTQDIKFGIHRQEIITQKELMVFSNPPRFVREGDTLELPIKITSLADSTLSGTASLTLHDAITGKEITSLFGKFISKTPVSIPSRQSILVTWKIVVPHGISSFSFTATSATSSHSDGETITVPVLPDRMLITEALPFSLRANQTKQVTFSRMLENNSSTSQNHSFTFEYTGNPAWYAVQALPYLMEYPYECSEQIFARFYANTLAEHIANSGPVIKNVFEQWKQKGKEAFLSNLEKNQDLKNILLEETPWVREASDEKEQMHRLALLFDLNKMAAERQQALDKLKQQQTPNGGWAWFKGMPDDRYITQYIVEGFGHLNHLGALDMKKSELISSMLKQAVEYSDKRLREDYERLAKNKADLPKKNISSLHIHYLYARSFFPDIPIDGENKKAFDYYTTQAKKYWLDNNLGLQAMIALTLHRKGDASSNDILKSLRERSRQSEELGMYWPSNESGFSWSQAPVETQAMLMEAFHEIAKDKNAVDEMKLWLLKNKQTNNWKSTKATAEACYALLLTGTDWLSNQHAPEINLGSKKMEATAGDPGSGYFKKSWRQGEVSKSLASAEIKNKNNSPAWGAMYWQYFENFDKITSDGLPLRIARKMFVERTTPQGPKIELITDTTALHPGDRIKVRVIIQTDRDMEYVHVKDLRAAGFEPENVLSGYRYQDGLGYYESTRDAATNFFIGFLPKGMYVFEYALLAAQAGSYSNGVATIQCMYAPEFSAHSEGSRIKIGNE